MINIGPYHAVLNTEAKLVLGVWTLDLYLDHWGQDFVIGIHAFAFQDFVQLLYLIYTWFPNVQTWRTGHCCQLHHCLVFRVLKYKLLLNLRLITNLNNFFVLCWIIICQIFRIGQNFLLLKFHLVFKEDFHLSKIFFPLDENKQF